MLEHPHDRREHPREDVDRNGQRERQDLGLLEGERLRDELAERRRSGRSSTANEITNATPRGRKSKYRETSGSPIAPSAIPTTVMPTWTVEMNLTGSSIIRSAVRAARLPRLGALLEPCSTCSDECVLGRDEDRVQKHEEQHDEDARDVAHRVRLPGRMGAPHPGARVLGGSSPSTQAEV